MSGCISTCVLGIEGMTCTSCSGTVENALRSIEGVISAEVNLSTNTADVKYRSGTVKASGLIDEVESVGFGAEVLKETTEDTAKEPVEVRNSVHAVVIGIEGMTCSSCSGTVENAIRSLPGVVSSSVIVALSTNTANFQYDPAKLTAQQIVDEIESVGFGAEILENNSVANEQDADERTPARNANMKTEEVGAIKTLLLIIDDPAVAAAQPSPSASTGAPSRRLGSSYAHHALPTASDALSSHGRQAGPGEPLTEDVLERMGDALRDLPGIQSVEVKTSDAQLKVTYDDFLTGPRDFTRLVGAAGYTCTVSSMGGFMMANRLLRSQAKETSKLYAQLVLSSALTVPIFCITMIFPMIPPLKRLLMAEIFPGLAVNGALLFLLSFPVQFYVGHQFHSKAWKTLKTRSLGMDFLVSTGTLAAYLYSTFGLVTGMLCGVPNMHDVEYFETSAVLITAVLLGKYLEVYAKGQTAAAIHKLSKLKANSARLVRSGTGAASSPTPPQSPQAPSSPPGLARTASTDSDAAYNPALSLLGVPPPHAQANPLHVGSGAAQENQDEEIDAALLHRRDIVRLVPGETVPADGQLLPGAHIGVDEAMMTGESALVPKTDKDVVFGGTIVIEGSALMRVTACGDDSTLGRIISTVQQAQASKPPIQELADRVARYFVPAIALISFVTFTTWIVAYAAGGVPKGWYASAGNPYLFAFFFALAVWVSACPCAFGLATPTAVLVSTGVAAKHGILIRKGAALQYASDVNVVAFDKTGTLTKGCTEVTDFSYCLEGEHAFHPLRTNKLTTGSSLPVDVEAVTHLLHLMLLAECRSSHPLAKGITSYCRSTLAVLEARSPSTTRALPLPSEDSLLFDVVPGLGIHMYTEAKPGSVPGSSVSVLVGSGKLLEPRGVVIPADIAASASSYRAGGKVAIYVAVNQQLRAVLGVSDAVRPEAAHVVRSLHSRGIACYMITGDETATAQAIAQAVGIPPHRILARAKPEDKKDFIEALQRSHTDTALRAVGRRATARSTRKLCVAFVGDGTNDSPALAVADVGFTMASGSDIAVEAGDMVLCKNDLHALLVALDLSKQTMTRIHMNYFWALSYNACLIPVAAGVLYPRYHFALAPMLAGAAMALSSVSIVLSSLLLVRYRPPQQFEEIVNKDAPGSDVNTKCDCPASSSLDLAVDQPDALTQLWRALTCSTRQPTADAMAPLLTPAQWRAAVAGAQSDARVAERLLAEEDDEFQNMDTSVHGVSAGRDRGKSSVWSVLRSIRLPGQAKAKNAYQALDPGAEESDDLGDVELGAVTSALRASSQIPLGKRGGGASPTLPALKMKAGCGCGKGNCKCGANCRCGEIRM